MFHDGLQMFETRSDLVPNIGDILKIGDETRVVKEVDRFGNYNYNRALPYHYGGLPVFCL